MHIRTFRAANLNDALRDIREQMGPDATVLHTRQIAAGAWSLWGRNRIEVTAGLRHQSTQTVATVGTAGNNRLTGESDVKRHSPMVDFATDSLLDSLSEMGVPGRIAKYWRKQSPDGQPAGLQKWLADQIPISDPIDLRAGTRRIVTLVGATGVGKTTTIAKLAGQFCIDQKSRVGLLTVDGFRAAAVEQLQAFAQALKISLEVVREVDQVAPALQRLADVDLLLVDSVGQSPRESRQVDRMGNLLRLIQPDESYLVLDANSSLAAARDSLRSFATLRPTALILSKVDEVSSAAPVIAAVLERNEAIRAQASNVGSQSTGEVISGQSSNLGNANVLGFSYVTTGQSVPRDIELAEASELANLASGLALETTGSVMSIPPRIAG